MKSKIPGWVVVLAIVVVVALVGYLGWKQVKPPEALSTAPPPFIDPVTRRPREGGAGSGMPKGGPPAGGAAAPDKAAGGGQ